MSLFGPEYPTLQRGLVHLKSGTSFRGDIWERKRGYLTLRNAELLRAKGETIPLPGEVAIYERDIEYIQLPGEVL